MSQWLDVKAGAVSDTWGVPAGETRSYLGTQTVYTTSPTTQAWYGWAMLGLAAVATYAALKGLK